MLLQIYRGSQCTYPCFPGVLLTSTSTYCPFQARWLLSHLTIVETIDISGIRGMNPVALSEIPVKTIGRAGGLNQRPPVFKSSMSRPELYGLEEEGF